MASLLLGQGEPLFLGIAAAAIFVSITKPQSLNLFPSALQLLTYKGSLDVNWPVSFKILLQRRPTSYRAAKKCKLPRLYLIWCINCIQCIVHVALGTVETGTGSCNLAKFKLKNVVPTQKEREIHRLTFAGDRQSFRVSHSLFHQLLRLLCNLLKCSRHYETNEYTKQ